MLAGAPGNFGNHSHAIGHMIRLQEVGVEFGSAELIVGNCQMTVANSFDRKNSAHALRPNVHRIQIVLPFWLDREGLQVMIVAKRKSSGTAMIGTLTSDARVDFNVF